MNKDSLSDLIPVFLFLAMIFVKIFVVCMIFVTVIVFFYLPVNTTSASEAVMPMVSETLPPTILSIQDAAIANSEWSKESVALASNTIPVTPFPIPTLAPTPTAIQIPQSDPAAAQTAIANTVIISSPLQGFEIGGLPELISQPFVLPPPGEDSGHHGVDFAFWNRGNKPILGNPIMAVFSGTIAMSDSQEKPPYGYALLIETPLDSLPQNVIHAIKIPTQPIGTVINNKLNCPDLSHDQWNSSKKSLYTLYGHMISAPGFKIGDSIQSGQNIGFVGNSGLSSAPHLHLEMRIGPSGATFANMGHYDPKTTEEDRHNYCNWRVSGVFQMFDPMQLLKPQLVTQ